MYFSFSENRCGWYMIDFNFNLGFTDMDFFKEFREIGKVTVEQYSRFRGPLYPNLRWVTIGIITDKRHQLVELVSKLEKHCWCIVMKNQKYHPPRYIDHKKMFELVKHQKIKYLEYVNRT